MEKRQFLPIIMTNLGKSIEIFPTYSNFIPISQTDPEKFINNILKTEKSLNKKSYYLHYEPDRIINIEFKPESIIDLLETGWFEKFISYLLSGSSSSENIKGRANRAKEVIKLKEENCNE